MPSSPIDAFRFSRTQFACAGFDAVTLSAIAVACDSMQPLQLIDVEILADHTPNPLFDGIHVARLADALMVKRLQSGVPGRVVLENDNMAYSLIEVRTGEVEVIGGMLLKSGQLQRRKPISG